MRFPMTLVLETPRLRLRTVSLEDVPHIFSATRDPQFNLGMVWDPPERMEDLVPHHESTIQAWEEDEHYCFTIEHRETGEFLGRIVIRPGEDREWNLGFYLHPDHQGHGYMTEAGQRMLEFGFDELNARVITAGHATWNIASARVMERLGMCFIRHVPEGFLKEGEWVAEDILGITREEWERQRES